MKTTFRSIAILLLMISGLSAQNTEAAKTYFKNYMSGDKTMALLNKSLPTSEECKLLFKSADDAAVYYTYVEAMKAQLDPTKKGEDFVDVKIDTYTTEDILNKKENYPGGMNSIGEKLQPKLTLYKVSYLRTVGAESGMAYQCWIYANKKWIFFPNPWNAFKTNPK
jgi:hypothetical protein